MQTGMRIKMNDIKENPEGQRLQLEFTGSGTVTFTYLDLITTVRTYVDGLNTLIELQLSRQAHPEIYTPEQPGNTGN